MFAFLFPFELVHFSFQSCSQLFRFISDSHIAGDTNGRIWTPRFGRHDPRYPKISKWMTRRISQLAQFQFGNIWGHRIMMCQINTNITDHLCLGYVWCLEMLGDLQNVKCIVCQKKWLAFMILEFGQTQYLQYFWHHMLKAADCPNYLQMCKRQTESMWKLDQELCQELTWTNHTGARVRAVCRASAFRSLSAEGSICLESGKFHVLWGPVARSDSVGVGHSTCVCTEKNFK